MELESQLGAMAAWIPSVGVATWLNMPSAKRWAERLVKCVLTGIPPYLGVNMYNVAKLAKLETQLALRMREHFVQFFRSYDYSKLSGAVVSLDVSSLAEIEA